MSEQGANARLQRDVSTDAHRKFWKLVDDAASRAPEVVPTQIQQPKETSGLSR